MKIRKIFSFVMLALFVCLTLCGFKATVKAVTLTSNLISIQGAQVRTQGSAGIRFVATVDESFDKTDVTAYGIALAFGEANISDVVIGGEVNGKNVLCAQVNQLNGNNYYVNLIDIPESMFGQKITTRSYVVKDDSIIYADSTTVRSLGQVTIAVKSAEQTSELIESVFTTLSEKYMKAYSVGEYVYINNAIYEYEPTNLVNYFLEDYNAVMGTSLTTIVGFAGANDGSFADEGSNTEIESNALYAFFNANNGEMLTKWGWVLDYVETIDENTYTTAQVNYINGTTAIAETNASWWGCRHLLANVEAFFTRTRVTSTGFNSNSKFNTNGEFANLVSTIDELDENQKFYALNDSSLIYIGNKISTQTIDKTGYELTGFNIGGVDYSASDEYIVTSTPVVVTPTFSPINYTITYMYNGQEVTELASTYNIEQEVHISSYDYTAEFDLEWYDNEEFSGEPVTVIPTGEFGDRVFYGKEVAKEYKEVNVVYDLNGGTFGSYSTYDEAVADYLKDYNTCRSTSHTVASFYALGAWEEISGASVFFYNTTYKAKWTWLVNYLATTATNSTTKKSFTNYYSYTGQTDLNNNTSGNGMYAVAYEVRGWVGQAQYTQNSGFVSADYSSAAVQASMLELIQGEKTATYKEPCALKTPTRGNYSFVGWKSSVDGQIITEYPGYYENIDTITYTAVWDITVNAGNYASLSAAISAAPAGATVVVPAGTYDEDITINKNNITIQGANAGIAGDGVRGAETIISGTISVGAVSGFNVNGCELTDDARITLADGASNFTFENNVITTLAYEDGIISQEEGTTVSNIKVLNNYSADLHNVRFVRLRGTVNNLDVIGNNITGTTSGTTPYHFVLVGTLTEGVINGMAKGTINICDNTFINSLQSGVHFEAVGALDCTIKGNYFGNITSTCIDSRNMGEDGAVSFVIENNEFNNSTVGGWRVIRIRSANYDANDSIYVAVNNNKFIDSYTVVDGYNSFANNPSYTGSSSFDAIYTVGRNYYEIGGVAITDISNNNFGNAAISIGEAYATEAEVPGF